MITFAAIVMLLSEYVSFEHSKGEVLVFRRGHQRTAFEWSADDEESQNRTSPNKELVGEDKQPETSPQTVLEPQKSIFHWENVSYEVSIKGNKRMILDHVNGWVKPGTLTALMVSVSSSEINTGI